jgi:peptidoglycan biosynthesis protein MviN/MurJ (putative lipid II flippase)
VILLTVVAALGVCAIGSAVMVPTMLGGVGAWPVIAGGCIALIAALVALWMIGSRRDRWLR